MTSPLEVFRMEYRKVVVAEAFGARAVDYAIWTLEILVSGHSPKIRRLGSHNEVSKPEVA